MKIFLIATSSFLFHPIVAQTLSENRSHQIKNFGLTVYSDTKISILKAQNDSNYGAFGKESRFYLLRGNKINEINSFAGPLYHELKVSEEFDKDGRNSTVSILTYSSGGVGSSGIAIIFDGKLYESEFLFTGPESKNISVLSFDPVTQKVKLYFNFRGGIVGNLQLSDFSAVKSFVKQKELPLDVIKR